jgi:transcription elongation GreA/GreB family factor
MGLMTKGGIDALKMEEESLRKKICEHTGDRAACSEYGQTLAGDRAADYGAILQSQGVTASQLAVCIGKLVNAREAPVPTQTDQVALGHLVKLVKHREKGKVEHLSILMGGPGEPDSYQTVKTVTSDSPLGRQILRKYSGDEVQIKTPSGVCTYEIREISVPNYRMKLKRAS